MKDFRKFKKEILKDKEIKKAYSDLAIEYDLIELIIEKRIEKGFTQKDLANKVGTKQSVISRLESGSYNPIADFPAKSCKCLG